MFFFSCIIVDMNKKTLLFFTFLLVTAVCFIGCTTTSSASKYVASVTEDGETYTYELTVDEKNDTFSIVRNSVPEYRYSGTFIFENGYLILQSEEKGKQYVRLIADEFSFFTPSSVTTPCTHDFLFVEEVEGKCNSRGYKRYVCSICNEEKTEITSYGDHSYALKNFDAGTCIKKSVSHYECLYCGAARDVEGAYGEHNWLREKEEDNGCLAHLTVTKTCSLCKTTEVVEEAEEFGAHTYDDNGVCLYCLFDKNGLCHKHADANEDGECDDCKMRVSALNGIREKGYYLDGDTLYFGAYPTYEADVSANKIRSEGMLDPTTGYYRYKNASYLITSRKNNATDTTETKVFAVTYLTWTKCDATSSFLSYKCDSIVRILPFVSPLQLTAGYHTKGNEPANDWLSSDLYAFANGEFIQTVFSEKQRELFSSSPVVFLPPALLADPVRKAVCTDYASFDSYGLLDLYFTSDVSEDDPMKIWCLHGRSEQEKEIRNVTSGYGFVPFVYLNVDLE